MLLRRADTKPGNNKLSPAILAREWFRQVQLRDCFSMIARRAYPSLAALKPQLLIFFASALLLALGMDRKLGVYDEGVILTAAMRVAAGEITHSDFYTNYGPAQFYVIATLFKLFGQYALVERAYDVLVRAMIVAVCFGLTATCTRKYIAVAVAVICGLWLFSIPFYGYPIFPVVLLSLVSAALVLPVLAGHFSPWRLVAAGATVGLAALFRYDAGFFVFVALGAVLTLSSVLRSGNVGHAPDEAKTIVLRYVLGTSIVFLPVAICYLAVAPITPFIHDILSYPIHYYARTRSLPFPGVLETIRSIDILAVYLPILICCATVYSVFLSRVDINRRRCTPSDDSVGEQLKDWLLIMFALLTSMLYLKGLVRVSVVHMLASLIPSLVLLAVLLDRAWYQGYLARIVIAVLCGLSLISAVYASITTARSRVRDGSTVLAQSSIAVASPRVALWALCGGGLPRIQCLLLDSDRAKATRFVIANTRADERIFVGLTRHDKIFANDNMIYFAAGRLPATRWHQFDPGLQTRADVQRQIIAELQARNVRCVVLESEWDDANEPNDSARSSGIHMLDEYIRQNYQPVQSYGKVSVLFRASQ